MGKKVLIVDNSLYSRMMLRDILISHGYSVTEVSSGEEALKIYETLQPDMVTIDTNLPGMDGTQTLRQITMKCSSAAVLICGTRGQRGAVMEGMSMGAAGVLLKPFNEKQILHELRYAMGRPPTM